MDQKHIEQVVKDYFGEKPIAKLSRADLANIEKNIKNKSATKTL